MTKVGARLQAAITPNVRIKKYGHGPEAVGAAITVSDGVVVVVLVVVEVVVLVVEVVVVVAGVVVVVDVVVVVVVV